MTKFHEYPLKCIHISLFTRGRKLESVHKTWNSKSKPSLPDSDDPGILGDGPLQPIYCAIHANDFDRAIQVEELSGATIRMRLGIGFSIAELLGFEEAFVVSSRKQKNVDEELKSKGIEVIEIECHVSNAQQRKNLIDKTVHVSDEEHHSHTIQNQEMVY
ncbi:hypothetical protein Q3G72_000682 [Acer saccharum]|nr:hypothetical protein Q3G72_000682 [Acer saccharum]